MTKKIIAILSVFALLFAMTACKNGLEGNLEGNTTIPATEATTIDIGATELYIDDGSGNMIPVVTSKNENGDIIYEYTDVHGNKLTQVDGNNVVGVTKYSAEEQVQIYIDQVSKEFESNPDAMLDNEKVDFIIADGLVPESNFKKISVELGENGRPVRDESKSYQKIISGDAFTLKLNVKSIIGEEETDVPLTWSKSGQSLLIETSLPVDVSGSSMKTNFLIKDSKCYVFFPAMRLYTEMPAEAFEEMFNPEIFESEVEDDIVYDASYEVKIGGKTYYCDVYETEDGTSVTKNYYDANSNPVRVEMVSGDNVTIWEITEISTKADTSKFKVPAGYFDISAVYGEGFDLGI